MSQERECLDGVLFPYERGYEERSADSRRSQIEGALRTIDRQPCYKVPAILATLKTPVFVADFINANPWLPFVSLADPYVTEFEGISLFSGDMAGKARDTYLSATNRLLATIALLSLPHTKRALVEPLATGFSGEFDEAKGLLASLAVAYASKEDDPAAYVRRFTDEYVCGPELRRLIAASHPELELWRRDRDVPRPA